MAYLLTRDWSLAEDLVQVALARAMVAWPRVGDENPDGYVRTVMINTYSSWWRRRWRGEVPTAEIPDSAGSDAYAAVDERAGLAAVLARLPRRQRITVVLRFHEDLTEAAVADVMGCSIGTLKSR
jgi:RNA polymerase sigma-70 factor (sigma-E family)